MMRKRISIYEPDVLNDKPINPEVESAYQREGIEGLKPFREILMGEGREDFVNYIEWLGLDKDPNPVVLSSMHHYYYDAEEMKKVNTVVNLIKLNNIKEIKEFLYSISHILSPQSNLIGCFIDGKNQNLFDLRKNTSASESKEISTAVENGIMSRIPLLNKIYSLIDAKTNKFLTKQNVTFLLEEHGFKVHDITEMNGLTYFRAKKVKTLRNSI